MWDVIASFLWSWSASKQVFFLGIEVLETYTFPLKKKKKAPYSKIFWRTVGFLQAPETDNTTENVSCPFLLHMTSKRGIKSGKVKVVGIFGLLGALDCKSRKKYLNR